MGRFRGRPVTNIILEDLGVVDESPEVFADARDPEARDLVPDLSEYVIGPGDVLSISIFELFRTFAEWSDAKQVSETGRITLPVIGTFSASGRTELELTEDIKNLLSPHIVKDPKVSIVVVGSRERVYSISGAVSQPGRYPLGETDFRISEALAQAGGIPQLNVDYAYVIRTVTEEELRDRLREEVGGDGGSVESEESEVFLPPIPRAPDEDEENAPESVRPLSGRVSEGKVGQAAGVVESLSAGDEVEVEMTIAGVVTGAEVKLLDETAVASEKALKVIRQGSRFRLAPRDGALPESEVALPREQEGVAAEPVEPTAPAGPRRGVRERGKEGGADRALTALGGLGQTYEVIRVELRKLRGGDWSQNVVIKSGDEIRVPVNAIGVFYMAGQVGRPGPYSLTGERMTLKQALATVGGMTALAWPSRCEIIRRVGAREEVTYRVNLEKLFAGTAPDLFIKSGDIVNVGSHPVARWMAVVRNSFRSTYGFGFVYDRNLADKDMGH